MNISSEHDQEFQIFHTQMDGSFLRLNLQNHFQLHCFPEHISYLVTRLHVSLDHRSRKKGNVTRRIFKILHYIFPLESGD